MEKTTILYVALALIYYHISGLATTNILRLTKGNHRSVLSSKCTCDSCGVSISPLFQLPILSYLLCRGRCKHCGTKIPFYPLILEIVVLSGMMLLSFSFEFSFLGITASFLYYEAARIITLVRLGKRESDFWKNYLIALLAMLPFYGVSLFVSLLYSLL